MPSIISIILLSVILCVFLAIGAKYDSNGALVPDDATVPFAAGGVVMSALCGRWFSFIFGLSALLFALYGKTPEFMKKISEKLLMRSYGTEEAIRDFDAELEEISEQFEVEHGAKLHMTLFVFSLIQFLVPVVFYFFSDRSVIALVPFLVSFVVLLLGFMYVYRQNEQMSETSEMTAFGGADVLVLIGLFGYYGGVAFVYAMVVTFAAYLLWSDLLQVLNGDLVWKAVPMLPVILWTIPLRLIIVHVAFSEMISSISFSFSDLETLKYLFLS